LKQHHRDKRQAAGQGVHLQQKPQFYRQRRRIREEEAPPGNLERRKMGDDPTQHCERKKDGNIIAFVHEFTLF
jgi:hypothetical protein